MLKYGCGAKVRRNGSALLFVVIFPSGILCGKKMDLSRCVFPESIITVTERVFAEKPDVTPAYAVDVESSTRFAEGEGERRSLFLL
jgi:hypothetical protein